MKKHTLILCLSLLACSSWSQIKWVKPSIPRGQTFIQSETRKLFIDALVLTEGDLAAGNFQILVNGTALGEDRLENVQVNGLNFTADILLEEGNQTIQILYGTGPKALKSESIVVYYNYSFSSRPSIHVLAVGTDPPDLQFATKDACDFANAFRGQIATTNRLFDAVYVKTLIGPSATADSIRLAVDQLVDDYKNSKKVDKKDLIILYLASHGFTDSLDNLWIRGNDYTPTDPRQTSVRYDEITSRLDEVQCKKLIFMDACHSGARSNSGAVNDAIRNLMESKAGYAILTSSKKEERSYEDEAWQNGAFTKAVLEGLEGAADASKDGIVSLNEVYDYIKSRVPEMVSRVKGEIQTPDFAKNDLGNIPIFVTSFFGKNKMDCKLNLKKILSGENYFIQVKHTNMFLDIPGASKERGEILQQYTPYQQDNQQFTLVPAEEEFFFFQVKTSGLFLDVEGNSTEEGAFIHQWNFHGTDNQKFRLMDAGEGYFFIQSKHSGRFLEIEKGSEEKGARLLQGTMKKIPNQMFKFIPAEK